MSEDSLGTAREWLQSGALDQHRRELEELAGSPEGKRLQKTLNSRKMEDAIRSGDLKSVQEDVGAILNTPEGMALAEKLKKMFE